MAREVGVDGVLPTRHQALGHLRQPAAVVVVGVGIERERLPVGDGHGVTGERIAAGGGAAELPQKRHLGLGGGGTPVPIPDDIQAPEFDAPPATEYGSRETFRRSWTFTFIPGLAIMLTALFINLFGNGLRDALDPRLKE